MEPQIFRDEPGLGGYHPLRDRLVCSICNWLLNHVASQRYRAMIDGSIRYGLKSAIEDEQKTADR